MSGYAYPAELARFVSGHWSRAGATGDNLVECGAKPELLEEILSVCYQASMFREELRPVMFRAIVCKPSCLGNGSDEVPDFHLLEFSEPREFTAHELRALSQAASFYRSLIGVSISPSGQPQIWGIVHTGPRWLREAYGGRRGARALPPSVVVCVNGPGYLEVCRGSILIGQLRDGTVFDESMNVFQSRWLPEQFAAERSALIAQHEANMIEDGMKSAELDPSLPRFIGQQFVKRLIAAVQGSHHGGTVLFVPEESREKLLGPNEFVNVKYRFADSEARIRYRTLVLSILRSLARQGEPDAVIGWGDYERSADEQLLVSDEALFEMSYLVAGLTAVDGAVLMTKRFEILGFGTEIICKNVHVPFVAKALDVEGESTVNESPETVGTRHRSAYRFVQCQPDSIAVVISQDGDVRVIRERDTVVTYWNHRPSLQVTA